MHVKLSTEKTGQPFKCRTNTDVDWHPIPCYSSSTQLSPRSPIYSHVSQSNCAARASCPGQCDVGRQHQAPELGFPEVYLDVSVLAQSRFEGAIRAVSAVQQRPWPVRNVHGHVVELRGDGRDVIVTWGVVVWVSGSHAT